MYGFLRNRLPHSFLLWRGGSVTYRKEGNNMKQTTEATPYRQSVHRGEVYFTEFSRTTGAEIFGTHPIVIVQNDIGNFYSGTVIGVVLTSSNKKETMPTHVILQEPGSPCNGSMAMAEQIFTIKKRAEVTLNHALTAMYRTTLPKSSIPLKSSLRCIRSLWRRMRQR